MKPGDRSNRRWQFSLGALFGVSTVAALFFAAVAGSFGGAVRDGAMNLGTILAIIGAGIVYYALLILVLCTPILLIAGVWKLLVRTAARRGSPAPAPQRPGAEPEPEPDVE